MNPSLNLVEPAAGQIHVGNTGFTVTQSSGNSRAISSTPMYTDLDTVSPAIPGVEYVASSGRLGDDAYSLLKTRILRGEFPLNMRLVETRLAKELGLSRTPVREALARLAAESLLAPHPDGGFQPRIPDTVAIRELYEVRAALENQALQRPGRNGTVHDPMILEPLRDYWLGLLSGTPPEPTPEFVLLDESFHVTLALSAGNRSTVELLTRVNERIRIIRMQDFLDETRIRLTIEEHLAIVTDVLEGNILAAEMAFGAHLAESMAFVAERAQAAIARMVIGA